MPLLRRWPCVQAPLQPQRLTWTRPLWPGWLPCLSASFKARSCSAAHTASHRLPAAHCYKELAAPPQADVQPSHAHARKGGKWVTPYPCPACMQKCVRLHTFNRHLQKCCPDLVTPQEWEYALQSGEAGVQQLLQVAAVREDSLRKQMTLLAYHGIGADGEPLKRSAEEVGRLMGLPAQRVLTSLMLARRAIPLVADTGPLEVVYEDEDLIAVNKPAGITTTPVHRFQGGSLLNRLIGYLGSPPYPLHRLDMDTTGVVVFGKRGAVVPAVHAQFRDQRPHKRYLALCAGVPSQSEFAVAGSIARHPTEVIARMVSPDGLPSLTDFSVLTSTFRDLTAEASPSTLASELPPSWKRGASLICCMPHTGRTHQIRVHLAHAGYPIFGDQVYGLLVSWAPRQLLHAASLTIRHPTTGQQLTMHAPLPPDFQHALAALALAAPAGLGGGVTLGAAVAPMA